VSLTWRAPKDATDEWQPHRGDYGTEYAGDLVELIEQRNCVQGCTLAGARKLRREVGPGGSCIHLCTISLGDPVTGFVDDGGDAPLCTHRVPPPPPVRRGRRRRAGVEPLFEVPS